jgi:hypothetical protein
MGEAASGRDVISGIPTPTDTGSIADYKDYQGKGDCDEWFSYSKLFEIDLRHGNTL